jgi:Flp pilus assembly pilin Flp
MDTSGKTGPRRVVQAGQGLVEYALILALIAVVAISGTLFLGKEISKVLANMGSSVGGQVLGDTSTGTGSGPGSYTDEPACEAAGYDWHNGSCRDNPDRYTGYASCFAAGFYWYGNSGGECHRSQPNSVSDYDHQNWCEAAGYYWHTQGTAHCQSSAPPTPSPSPGSYSTYQTCFAGGFYWWGTGTGSCHQDPPSSASGYTQQLWCEAAGKHWHYGSCHNP